MENKNLLIVDNLKKYYPVGGRFFGKYSGWVKALDGVSLSVKQGETLGLVGESGCGKSTFGRCILRLEESTSGSVNFDGRDIFTLDKKSLRALRKDMQVVFQDPFSSLNPRKRVGRIISEAFRIHGMLSSRQRNERIKELFRLVGLQPESTSRFPHEFSGGQRQRICVARALALNPKLIIADEPVSALDVSIQAQILNLLSSLQSSFELTYVFISHDLSVVRHISDRVAVMYLGRLVELASVQELYSQPLHPYTQALLLAVPAPDPRKQKDRTTLTGDVPSPINPPKGCSFHPRCPYNQKICSQEVPKMREIKPGHTVACHFPWEKNYDQVKRSDRSGRQPSQPELRRMNA